jgi:hypothetical protein
VHEENRANYLLRVASFQPAPRLGDHTQYGKLLEYETVIPAKALPVHTPVGDLM